MDKIINIINDMKNHSVHNYVLAGLSSSLIGGNGYGRVRLFEKPNHQHDNITPHNHRFDFTCLVLKGFVINRLWEECGDKDKGDFYQVSKLHYSGEIGKHRKELESRGEYSFKDYRYNVGETYHMKSNEIHSILFSKDSSVLFFEGPTIRDSSIILEPIISGEVIPTYLREDWMFQTIIT